MGFMKPVFCSADKPASLIIVFFLFSKVNDFTSGLLCRYCWNICWGAVP